MRGGEVSPVPRLLRVFNLELQADVAEAVPGVRTM